MDADLETECRRLHARVVKARPGMDQLIRQTLTQVASRLSPRGIGRMAHMRADRKTRRMAVGA